MPPYTNAAEQCISVGDTFFADDTCLEYYRALSLRSSVTAVNDAANALCASQMCMDRMDSYISYLVTCRVGSIADEDDDDDDDDDNDVCCKHNAKQKQPGCKKSARPIRSQVINDQNI